MALTTTLLIICVSAICAEPNVNAGEKVNKSNVSPALNVLPFVNRNSSFVIPFVFPLDLVRETVYYGSGLILAWQILTF